MRLAHVLTYHSGNIAGNDYATNDLVAFREDLRIIRRLGLCIIALPRSPESLAWSRRPVIGGRCRATVVARNGSRRKASLPYWAS